MYHSKEWKGLEHWSYFHHFLHFCNNSPPLPGFFYTLQIIITSFQTFPILFGIPILKNPRNNKLIRAVTYLSDLFIYFNFSPTAVSIGFMLVFDFCTIFLTFLAYTSDKLIFTSFYPYVLHFIYQILAPIMFNLSSAILQQEITNSVYGDTNYFYLISALISTVIFFCALLLSAFSHSDSVYFSYFYFESWSSWTIFFKIVSPSFILLFLPLRAKWDDVGFYVVDLLIFIYSIFCLVYDSKIPFLNDVMNLSYLLFDFFFNFLAIFNIFPHIFDKLDPAINIAIVMALFFLSIPCSLYLLYSKSNQLDKLIAVDVDLEQQYYDTTHENSELSDFADYSANDQTTEEMNDDESYPSYLAKEKVSILILRHLTSNRIKSTGFARFLFKHSSNCSIWLMSARYLILRKAITPDEARMILNVPTQKVPLCFKQPICDAQYEAVGLNVTKNDVKQFIDEIDRVQYSIIVKLEQICESIKSQKEQPAHQYVIEYSRACNEYELLSFIFLAHSSNCSSLLHRLSDYYVKLRGDFIRGNFWSQKLENFNIPLFNSSGSRKLLLSASSNLKTNDTTLINRVKSETLVQKIQSKAIITSSVIFIVLFLILVFFAFYPFETSNLVFVSSPVFSTALLQIATHSIPTISAQMNLSMQIFNGCNPQFAEKMKTLNSTLLWPSDSTVNLISTLTQNITKCISGLNDNINGSQTALYIWSDPTIKDDGSTSLQLQVVELNMISSLIRPGICDDDSLLSIDAYIRYCNVLTEPMVNLHESLTIYSDTVFKEFYRDYVIYCSVFDFVIIALIIGIIIVLAQFEHQERRNFWNVFKEVDHNELDRFQRVLSNPRTFRERIQFPLAFNNSRSSNQLKNSNTRSPPLKPSLYPRLGLSPANDKSKKSSHHFSSVSLNSNDTTNQFVPIDHDISSIESSLDSPQGKGSSSFDSSKFQMKTSSNETPLNSPQQSQHETSRVVQVPNEPPLLFKVSRLHPQHINLFIIYSIITILLISLIMFIMLIPYHRMQKRFDNLNFDLENIEYIATKMFKTASLTPLLYNQVNGGKYVDMWSTNAFDITDFSSTAKNEKYETATNNMIEYNKKMETACHTFQDSGYLDVDSIYEIIGLAYRDANEIAFDLLNDAVDSINQYHHSFVIISHIHTTCIVIILIFYTFVFILHVYAYHLEFDSMKSVLLLLSSPYSTSIANLIAMFSMSKRSEKQDVDINKFQSRYIIKQSTDAVIVLDSMKKIQDVNKSTIEMLELGRDKLIGEPIENLISRDHENDQQTADFFAQLNFSNTRQAAVAPRYNLHVIGANRKLTPVSCTLLLIGNEAQEDSINLNADPDSNNQDKPWFALVLRDRTYFNEQEKKLQDAKKNVEVLLYRILPRVMANKLLSKSTNLHSKVDKATIIFIAIVNFLDWCRLHTHTEIMELLDVIVTKFDRKISQYPTLVKLKIINGVYMAAGGLFNEVSNNSHEVEAIEFAIKCGKAIHKQNMRQKSNLQLQIGINTGGPIIAGILGSDKPLFDIWGDAVNVSARLETSAPFDTVQTLQETVDALPPNVYKFTQREKVFLKGKGEATTFVLDLHDPYLRSIETENSQTPPFTRNMSKSMSNSSIISDHK